ncbi:endocuticle structural glycoprotein SgAbd-1-like [Belonocnema kinseyi]|uniref:endocuticle structural glycoprotein SgAbd-1-like n=1 Tax=Belonocnema kinseyi TaxID=2817044 RepID=UPI00143DA70A|nr:endocuticle structural glycoprotein SgAbd-1-like [Belonocnema kinseyi]
MKFAIASLFALVALASAAPAVEQTPKPIAILRSSENGPNPDGSYNWSYETENGIQAQEQGELRSFAKSADAESNGAAVVAQGAFSYTADDGTPISLTYIADENGFQPQGAHLPVTPAVPEGILRALEWIANHPEEDKLTK